MRLTIGGRAVLLAGSAMGVTPYVPFTITSVGLSSATVYSNAQAGSPLGDLSVTTSDGHTHAATFALNANANFTLGDKTISLAGTLTAGSYTVAGTVTVPGATNSPFAWTKAATVLPPPPAQVIFASPSSSWVQTGQTMPAMAATLVGLTQYYARLTRFGAPEGQAVASGAGAASLAAPASAGTYTVRAYFDAGCTQLIGESAPIGVWDSASGPASAALTIDASSVPSNPVQGQPYTLTGVAITSNNYVLIGVANNYAGNILCAPVVNGRWSQTRLWPGSGNTVGASDPSTGLAATAHTNYPSSPTGSMCSMEWHADGDNTYLPFLTTSSVAGQYYGYFRGCVGPDFTNPVLVVQQNDGVTIPYGGVNYIKTVPTIAPGTYNVTGVITSDNKPPVTVVMPLFVPYSVPATDVAIDIVLPVTDKLLRFSVVGSVRSYSASNNWLAFMNDPSGYFVIPNVYRLPGQVDLRTIVTYEDNVPAGTYPVQVTIVEGPVSYTKALVITVAAASIAGTISYTPPTGITNLTAIGSSLGMPTVSGMTGPVTWGLVQDRSYRAAINPATGAMTVRRYMSGIGGGEVGTLIATDGVRVATLAYTIPVGSPGSDVILEVGAGKAFTTITAALENARSGAKNNAVIKIYPGTYQDDLGVMSAAYLDVHLTFLGVADANGRKPLIKYTEPTNQRFYTGKGAFNGYGRDLTIRNLEIAHARSATGGTNFNYAVQTGDSPGSLYGQVLWCDDCIIHDCDDGIGRGTAGQRTIITHSVFAWNPSGTGYDHHVYVLGNSLRVENCLFWGGSNGHVIKSRCDTAIVRNNVMIATNDSSLGSIIDVCDGGDLTFTGNTIWQGPNTNNAHCVEYGAELGGGGPTDQEFGLGNRVLIDNNKLYNLMPPGDFYSNGHQQAQAILNSFDGNSKRTLIGLAPAHFVVTNNEMRGFQAGRFYGPDVVPGSGNTTISDYTGIPSYETALLPTNWPLLTPTLGFTDTVVGPTYAPQLDNGNSRVPTVWQDATTGRQTSTFSHTLTVGSTIAVAHTVGNPTKFSDVGPFSYSITYADAAHQGLLSVTSDGHLQLAASAASLAGQIVTIYVATVSSSTHNDAGLLASFWIT